MLELASRLEDERLTVNGMVRIHGGRFRMGSDNHYPEEGPAHDVIVDDFLIDATPITNAQFARFVAATGYLTTAEMAPDPRDYPGALPDMLKPGSLVFVPARHGTPLTHWQEWWHYAFGAQWRHPLGSQSNLDGLDDHPVVHVSHLDALAYAEWAGKSLPTEAEWEYASRGGLQGADYAWGNERLPDGQHLANTWQGEFPWENTREDGWLRTSPVRAYPANGYGLFDMIGNVWEWTADYWTEHHPAPEAKACCIPRNPRVTTQVGSADPCQPEITIPRAVLKGGSHLCAPSYCQRYRPAARHPEPTDTSTSHVGFRCIRRFA